MHDRLREVRIALPWQPSLLLKRVGVASVGLVAESFHEAFVLAVDVSVAVGEAHLCCWSM